MSLSIRPMTPAIPTARTLPRRQVRFGDTPDGGKNPDGPPKAPSKTASWWEKFRTIPIKDRVKNAFNNVIDMFRLGPTQSGRNIKLFMRSMAIHVAWITLFSVITSLGAAIPMLPALMPVYAGISATYQVADAFFRGLFGCNTEIKPKDPAA